MRIEIYPKRRNFVAQNPNNSPILHSLFHLHFGRLELGKKESNKLHQAKQNKLLLGRIVDDQSPPKKKKKRYWATTLQGLNEAY